MSDRKFTFDVRNFVAGTHRICSHVCELPASNHRFSEKVPLPTVGKMIQVVGCVCGPSIPTDCNNLLKRIPIEVSEISFLENDFVSPSANGMGNASSPHCLSVLMTALGLGRPPCFLWGKASREKGKQKLVDNDDDGLKAGPSKHTRRT